VYHGYGRIRVVTAAERGCVGQGRTRGGRRRDRFGGRLGELAFRDAMLDQKAWISPGTYVGNNTNINGTPTVLPITQGFYRYYVGDGQGNNVDYAPHEFNNNGTYNFVWGRAAAGTLPAVWNSEPTRMGLAATTDSSGISTTNGAGQAVHNKVVLKTVGTVLQSHFLNEALVVTLVTRDVDICCRFSEANLMRIQNAFADVHPTHRPRTDLPLDLTPEQCAGLKNLYLKTDLGIVDCLGEILGVGPYDEVARHAVEIELPTGKCRVLDIDALIRAKQAMDRDHDRITVKYLKEIQKNRPSKTEN